MLTLRVNGKTYQVDAEPTTPLLWVLRDSIGLTGTKFGCGIAQCGACTVHVDGRATRSCVLPVSTVLNSEITTIEGLSPESQHPAQRAWIEQNVPQCGYCQSGQIMAVAALLSRDPNPSDSDIDREITNICRCGTYQRIRMAIHRASEIARG
ncbi:MAG TPA: (2Fe-2S)-binding protein [Candidatus Tectomicrobia bacterium]